MILDLLSFLLTCQNAKSPTGYSATCRARTRHFRVESDVKSTRASNRRILQFNYCQVSGPSTRFIQELARESCRYRKPRLVCSRREHGETGVPDAYSARAGSTVRHPARNRQRTVATQGNKTMCACAVSCSSSREETLQTLAGTRHTMVTQGDNERGYLNVCILTSTRRCLSFLFSDRKSS